MFKERLITGVAVALLSVLMILRLPDTLFLILSLGLVLMMAWEWCKLAELSKKFTVLYLIGMWFALGFGFAIWRAVTVLSALFWLVVPVLFFMPLEKTKLLRNPYIHLVLGVVVLMPFWIALNLFQQYDVLLLVYLILTVVVFDSAAYAVGSNWGSTKLVPLVSPNKTLEGLAGGALIALLTAFIMPFLIPAMAKLQNAHGFLMAIVAVIFCSVGDLLESLVKRQFGAKDSGSLLPGHGGLLDRLDSLTAVLPVTFCLLLFWGQYYRV